MTNMGFEVDVLLKSHQSSRFSDITEFAEWLVRKYNENTNGNFAMHSNIDDDYDGTEEFSEWSLTDDSTLGVSPDNCKSKCRNTSPRNDAPLDETLPEI
jgi:hypothetical protein